jgi:AraC family transcriptional regulator
MLAGSASHAAAGRIGPTWLDGARASLGTTIWDAPDVVMRKSRSWRRASAALFNRTAGEGCWRSDQYRLFLSLSDLQEATVQIDGGRTERVKPSAPHHLTFTPAGVDLHTIIPQAEFTAAQILQSPETYRDLAAEVSSPVDFADFEPKLMFNDPQMAALIHAIVREIDGGFVDQLSVSALNTALAVALVRHFHGSAMRPLAAGRLSGERLRRVLDYIEDHIEDSLSLSELAAIGCLSPFHFSRCFKRSMGMGLQRYLIRRRIEHARRLIVETDISLTDIAAATGFDNQASFTYRFGQEIGVSPGRLRRESV